MKLSTEFVPSPFCAPAAISVPPGESSTCSVYVACVQLGAASTIRKITCEPSYTPCVVFWSLLVRTSVQAGPFTSSMLFPEPATGTASAANTAASSATRFLNVASLLRDEGGVGAAEAPARASRPGEGDRHALVRDPLALEVGDERG